MTLLAQFAEVIGNRLCRDYVKTVSRLVEDYKLGFMHDRNDERNFLLHARGEICHLYLGEFIYAEARKKAGFALFAHFLWYAIKLRKEIKKVKLSEEVVDPDDIEMLEDLIVAATNEAMRMADEASAELMGKMTGGLGGLGGGFPF